MRAAVVNLSHPHYNLACYKLANWLRSEGCWADVCDGDPGMFIAGYDLVCLSAIFSWDVPPALEIVFRLLPDTKIWCGGPGFFRLARWWKEQTGIDAHVGLDPRFELQRGEYRMAFASRGCPENCHYCIVTPMEGKEFTFDWDFQPAPILCDNNLSALPVEYQQHIIRRYQDTGVRLLDANSGFEPKDFDEDTFERWKPIMRGPWRYAFDILPEWRNVQRVCRILKDVDSRKKRIYVLIGNEPIEVCYERATKAIEWGGEPFCQPMMRLDSLEKEPIVQHDWTRRKLIDFARYFNRLLFKRNCSIQEYKPRQNEPAPFAYMSPAMKVL